MGGWLGFCLFFCCCFFLVISWLVGWSVGWSVGWLVWFEVGREGGWWLFLFLSFVYLFLFVYLFVFLERASDSRTNCSAGQTDSCPFSQSCQGVTQDSQSWRMATTLLVASLLEHEQWKDVIIVFDDEHGMPFDQPVFFYLILKVLDDENGRPYDQSAFFLRDP